MPGARRFLAALDDGDDSLASSTLAGLIGLCVVLFGASLVAVHALRLSLLQLKTHRGALALVVAQEELRRESATKQQDEQRKREQEKSVGGSNADPRALVSGAVASGRERGEEGLNAMAKRSNTVGFETGDSDGDGRSGPHAAAGGGGS